MPMGHRSPPPHPAAWCRDRLGHLTGPRPMSHVLRDVTHILSSVFHRPLRKSCALCLCPLSSVLCPVSLSSVLCPMSHVRCPMSAMSAMPPMSCVLCPMSYVCVLCPMSYVLCSVTCVLCPMPHVPCAVSYWPVICPSACLVSYVLSWAPCPGFEVLGFGWLVLIPTVRSCI